MSTPDQTGADGSDDHRVPTTDDYQDEVYERRWVELVDFDGYFEVREMPPMRVLRDMERYGVKGLLRGTTDPDNAADSMDDGDLGDFMDNTILPNIVRPNCYWTVEKSDGADEQVGDGDFDLSALTKNDLAAVIRGMLAGDDDELENMDPEDPDSFLEE